MKLNIKNRDFINTMNEIQNDNLDYSFTQIKNQLSQKNPEFDDYQLNYWAARIAIFNSGNCIEGSFTLELDTYTEEATKISLTLFPNYHS